MSAPDLPGYRYDPELKRYFKIESIRPREDPTSLVSSNDQSSYVNIINRPKKRANIEVVRDPIRLLQPACRNAVVDSELIGPELPIANLCAFRSEDQHFVVGSCGDGSLIYMDNSNFTECSQLIPSGGTLSENTPEAIALEEARKSVLVWHSKRPSLLAITATNDNQRIIDVFNFGSSEAEQLGPIPLTSQANCAAWLGNASLVVFGNKNQRSALIDINAGEPVSWLSRLSSDALCCTAVGTNLVYIGLRSGQFAFTDARQVSVIQSQTKFNAPIESLQLFSTTTEHRDVMVHAPAGIGKPSTFLLDFRMLGDRGPLLTFDLQCRPGSIKPVLTCLDHDDRQVLLARDIRYQGLQFFECGFGSKCAETTCELPGTILSHLPLQVGPKIEILLGTGRGLSLCRTQRPDETDK